jgi:histone H3/H4
MHSPMCPDNPDKADTLDSGPRHFRVCSSCRKPLAFEARYYVCSVSTCNRAKTALTFCSLPCFEAHVPMLRHREAWAEEKVAPTRAQFLAEREQIEAQEHEPHEPKTPLKSSASDTRAKVKDAHLVDTERFDRTVLNRSTGENARAADTNRNKELAMSEEVPKEVLVVISKVKSYIRAKSSMNTSDAVTEALSELVRTTCDQAIERAKNEGRKTVMARDIAGNSGAPE